MWTLSNCSSRLTKARVSSSLRLHGSIKDCGRKSAAKRALLIQIATMQGELTPGYVYKLIPTSSPIPHRLPEKLPVSAIDEKSGFIHLSTGSQLLGTLNTFFNDDEAVYVLRLPYARIATNIKWESPEIDVCGSRDGEGAFPVRRIYASCRRYITYCLVYSIYTMG